MVDTDRPVPTGGVQSGHNASSLIGPRRIGRHDFARLRGGRPGSEVVRERQDPLIPEFAGLLHQTALGAGVVQPDIGDPASLFLSRLGSDPRPGIRLIHPTNADQPVQPHVRIGVHHHDQREQRGHLGFDQQRNVFDDHLILRHRCDDLGAPRCD